MTIPDYPGRCPGLWAYRPFRPFATKVRSKLWNAHFSLVPRMNERLRGKWITGHGYSPDRIYPSLCCIAYWLNAIDEKTS